MNKGRAVHRTRGSALAVVVLAGTFLLAVPVGAAPEEAPRSLAVVQLSDTMLSLTPQVGFERAVLRVSGPGGYNLSKQFGNVGVLNVDLRREASARNDAEAERENGGIGFLRMADTATRYASSHRSARAWTRACSSSWVESLFRATRCALRSERSVTTSLPLRNPRRAIPERQLSRAPTSPRIGSELSMASTMASPRSRWTATHRPTTSTSA